MNYNQHIATLEIVNVLNLYKQNDVKSINRLLEISLDLPTNDLTKDTKTLITLILKHNFVENKALVLNTSKVLLEGVNRDNTNIPEEINKLSAGELERRRNKRRKQNQEGGVNDVEDSKDAELKDREEYLKQKAADIPNMDDEELSAFKQQLMGAVSAGASSIVYTQAISRINEKLNTVDTDKVVSSAPGMFEKIRNSSVGKFVANNKGKLAIGAAIAGIAGLGYMLWKKYKGDVSKTIDALETKRALCTNQQCIDAVNKEMSKVREKGE